MNTKNKFHGIILGIYADMIGIKYEKGFIHLMKNENLVGSKKDELAKVLRENHDFNDVYLKWNQIMSNPDLSNMLQDHFNSKPYKFSDDTVLTCATIAALNENQNQPDFAKYYHLFGNKYPNSGYGMKFEEWLKTDKPGLPYGGTANGALMRLAPIGYLNISLDEKIRLTSISVSTTHNTFEAVNPAKEMIRVIHSVHSKLESPLKATYNLLYDLNKIELTKSLPLLPYDSYDDECASTLENALSIISNSISPDNLIYNIIKTGGDTDTIGMVAGSIYGSQKDFMVPEYMQRYVYDNLPEELRELVF